MIGQEIEMADMIEVLRECCLTLSNIIIDSKVSQDIHCTYDIMKIMREIIENYFLNSDVLNIQQHIAQKDEKEIKQRIQLLTEMMFLTNNFMSEHGQYAQKEDELTHRLDQTYHRILVVYTGF